MHGIVDFGDDSAVNIIGFVGCEFKIIENYGANVVNFSSFAGLGPFISVFF